ncbi:hypothetical protein HDV03_003220 [Kappamyces sp. JEL0829]|nr:hypothetical protein HDV03_003220 [Kappamyces sp. JEL0829]
MISLTVILLVMETGAVITAFVKKLAYPPFKASLAKQLEALAVSLLASWSWDFSNLQSLGIVDLTAPFWSSCIWWVVWAQLVLGVSMYLNVLIYRLNRLYIIIVLAKKAEGISFWGPVVGFWLLSVVLGLVGIAYDGTVITAAPVVIDNWPMTCHFLSNPFLMLMYFPVLLQLIFLYYLNFRLAKIRSAFNEVSIRANDAV